MLFVIDELSEEAVSEVSVALFGTSTPKYMKWARCMFTATMNSAIMMKTRRAAFIFATVFEWSRVMSVNLGWMNNRAANRCNGDQKLF